MGALRSQVGKGIELETSRLELNLRPKRPIIKTDFFSAGETHFENPFENVETLTILKN